MSLDFYLNGPNHTVTCECSCGHRHQKEELEELFRRNITHNLNRMAAAAGIYDCLWRPDEHGLTKASQIIEPLRAGLARLEANPSTYRRFDAANGWGRYEHMVTFARAVLAACEAHPDADVRVST